MPHPLDPALAPAVKAQAAWDGRHPPDVDPKWYGETYFAAKMLGRLAQLAQIRQLATLLFELLIRARIVPV
jgi:hypothetical protein